MKKFILLGVLMLLNSTIFVCFGQSFNPLSPANGFNAFIKNNVTFKSGETHAPVAMGGNAILQGQVTIAKYYTGTYPFGLDNVNNYGLVVGGRMTYTSGSISYLENGFLRLGNTTGSSLFYKNCTNVSANFRLTPYNASCNTAFNAVPRVELKRQQTTPTATDAHGLDFTSAYNTFTGKAAVMARYQPGSTLAASLNFPVIYTPSGSSTKRITLVLGKVNVINMTGAQFNSLSSLTFDNTPSSTTPLIFNINQTGDFAWNSCVFNSLDYGDCSYILYNFYNNSSNIKLENADHVYGSLFAPSSSFELATDAIISGQVVASNLVITDGYLGHFPFNALLPDDTNDPLTAIYRTKNTGVFSLASTWLYNPYGNTFIDAVTPPASTNIAYVMASHVLTLDVNYTVGTTGTFTINPTGSMVVNPNIVFTVQGVADFNGQSVTFKSTAAGTGILGNVTGTLADATNIVAEHYIAPRRSYRFLSPGVNAPGTIRANWQDGGSTSSVYGTHITGTGSTANGFDWTQTNNPSLFTLNNSSGGWSAVGNTTTSGVLTVGSAYRLMVRGNRLTDMSTNTPTPTPTTLRTTGSLKTGNHTPALNNGMGKYSFVGNPYLSPVDWIALQAASTGISTSYGVWDARIAGVNGRGAYISYNAVSRINSNPLSSSIDANIQSGQAFLVTNTAATPAMTFKESYKTTTNRNVFRTAGAPVSKLTVQLLFPSQEGTIESTDGLVALFCNDFSTAIHEEDSYKLTNLDENIAIDRNGELLSIEGRPTIVLNDTLPLKMWQLADSSYLLKIEATDFDPTVSAFVYDKYLDRNFPVNITGTTIIRFDLTDNVAKAADRFKIIFRVNLTLPVTITNVKGYRKSKGIQVEWISNSETNIDRYEVERSVNGQDFKVAGVVTATGNNNSTVAYAFYDATPVNGNNFYRIKSIDKSGTIKYTEIIKVSANNNGNGISFYPNPVTGSAINVEMTNMVKGSYTINIINAAGQTVITKNIEHAGGSATQTIDFQKGLYKGAYTIQILRGDVKVTRPVIFQ